MNMDGGKTSEAASLNDCVDYLRSIKNNRIESLSFLLKEFDELGRSDGGVQFDALLDRVSDDPLERTKFVSDVLTSSFETLDRHDEFWSTLLSYGADPAEAIRVASADANLGDNLNWLLDNIPDTELKRIFSDKEYADAVFDIAKESVSHDVDSRGSGADIGFNGFKRIACLCGREVDADRYYGVLLGNFFGAPVYPAISRLVDSPSQLIQYMNRQCTPMDTSVPVSDGQAKAILDFCDQNGIKFYLAGDDRMYSLDVSENYNGSGMYEDKYGVILNGIEYARKSLGYGMERFDEYDAVEKLFSSEKASRTQYKDRLWDRFIENVKCDKNCSEENLLASVRGAFGGMSKFEIMTVGDILKEKGGVSPEATIDLLMKETIPRLGPQGLSRGPGEAFEAGIGR